MHSISYQEMIEQINKSGEQEKWNEMKITKRKGKERKMRQSRIDRETQNESL